MIKYDKTISKILEQYNLDTSNIDNILINLSCYHTMFYANETLIQNEDKIYLEEISERLLKLSLYYNSGIIFFVPEYYKWKKNKKSRNEFANYCYINMNSELFINFIHKIMKMKCLI